jgi:hypothetical protein
MIRMSRSLLCIAPLSFGVLFVGCGSKDEENQNQGCSVEAQTGCQQNQVCEAVEGGKPACFAPVTVEGRVIKTADGKTGIQGARVVARDVNGAMASLHVAVSGADGAYKLSFPTTRKADGTPSVGKFTLRADAAGYATFPSGLRTALPVDTTQVVKNADGSYSVKNVTTDIGLDALPNPMGLGSISGIVKAPTPAGTLVVAGTAEAPSGIADRDGTFTIFNVPAGSQPVAGYLQGLQLKPTTANVPAGGNVAGVELLSDPGALATVTGDVSFVNAGSSASTIVLVVDATYQKNLQRGEVPKGLRTDVQNGKYTFTGVPAGKYVVLAAFENDGLVRDPDTTIGGTATQFITVANAAVTVTGFKITGALNVNSPGASGPEGTTNKPTFSWADDSSEDGYEVVVYDTFGKEIWRKADIASVSGSGAVTQVYEGTTALETGKYYQFRAYSWRDKTGKKTYISATEDLKGVFFVK